MIEVDKGSSVAPSLKTKRRSYMKRQAALKKLNEHSRRKGQRLASSNPIMRPPHDIHTEATMSTNKEEVFRASHAYAAEADDEIDLIEGDALDRMEDLGGGWWQGRNARTGEIGAFPASYVERTEE